MKVPIRDALNKTWRPWSTSPDTNLAIFRSRLGSRMALSPQSPLFIFPFCILILSENVQTAINVIGSTMASIIQLVQFHQPHKTNNITVISLSKPGIIYINGDFILDQAMSESYNHFTFLKLFSQYPLFLSCQDMGSQY